jgi:hypothetical protein
MRLHSELDTPAKVAAFLSHVISTQTGVIMETGSVSKVVYAFTFKGSQRVHYLELVVDNGKTGPKGRLHTVYPVDGLDRDKYIQELEDKYKDYQQYFEKTDPSIIQNNPPISLN